jgi:hypothetical protein
MKYRLGILVLGSLIAGVGCSEGPPPAGRADKVAVGQYPQIVAVERLDKVLRFNAPIVEPSSPGRPMSVVVPVRNIDRKALNVQYKFSFEDEAGRPLRTNTGWKFATLAGDGVGTTMESNSLEDTAADWRLEIRPAR